jgi:hypothetical protein
VSGALFLPGPTLIAVGLAVLGAGYLLLTRPSNASRPWTYREVERFQRTGEIPAWMLPPRRRDR